MTTLILAAFLAGCADSSDPHRPGPSETGDSRPEGEDSTVEIFDAEHIQFGAENRRQVDVEVTFPDDAATYSAVTGSFRLDCPNGRCDHWDRYGTFGIVENPGAEDERYVEIDRFITAYRVGFSWEADLTDVRPLLVGTRTLRVFIDTWVGEGHDQGDGWLFDAAIAFTGGPAPVPEAVAVLPVWAHLSWNAGLPDDPVADQVPPALVALPADLTSVVLRSFITGHGWNNPENCAEFCPRDHTFTVGDGSWTKEVWRKNCDKTETDGTQQGTWTYPRAGWCPGAKVRPWDIDVSGSALAVSEVEVGYALEDYAWSFEGDQPYYYLSGHLIGYR